jgi:putative two-component system hydrogenase maturation factor HypX/HoxX
VSEARLPIGTREARELGLVDDSFGRDRAEFETALRTRAADLARDKAFPHLLEEKRRHLRRDNAAKSLDRCRAEELEHMKLNFYGFDPSYHVARHNFVYKVPKSRTPPVIAAHRRASGRSFPYGESANTDQVGDGQSKKA